MQISRWPRPQEDVWWETSKDCRLGRNIVWVLVWLTFFKPLQEDPPAGVSGAPTENNIMLWNAVIFGPHETPFEVGDDKTASALWWHSVILQDGTFKLTLEFSEEYPNKPPVVKFLSKMFHPNIYADGGICLDILQNRWSPTYDVSAILTSIQSLVTGSL